MKRDNNEQRPKQEFDLENFLPYRLSVLANTISQGIAQIYQKIYGLSVPEWRVVAILGRYPGLTASEVGERTVMDKVTVSRAVNALLHKNFIERLTHRNDRRKRPLRLTSGDGQSMLDDLLPKVLAYETALQSAMTRTESRDFDQLIDRLQRTASQLHLADSIEKRG